MANFSKRIAVLALAGAAGCADSFDPVAGPLDRFNYPIGIAVRRLPAGNTALLVVSTNFDLRYDYDVGGAVLAVDPDASGDALAGDPTLAVLGGVNIGSFGGEVAYLDDSCAPLAAADSLVAAGGAKVAVAARGKQIVYTIDMDGLGKLTCDGCGELVRAEALDPYGVTTVCASRGGVDKVATYVTHLRSPGNAGWLTQIDLLKGKAEVDHRIEVFLGNGTSHSSTLIGDRVFVSTRLYTVGVSPLRWLELFQIKPGTVVPISEHNVAGDVTGALTRKLAVSTDGTRGYLMLDLFDYDLASRSATFVSAGGALAVYDLTESALGEPQMELLRLVPTCIGSGEAKVMARAGQRDLVALTCDTEGVLLFYDDEVGTVVRRIGLDAVTGQPVLGRMPLGMAMEQRGGPGQGPCLSGGQCTRLYVASFERSWVNLVELDPAVPAQAALVKRIGRERE